MNLTGYYLRKQVFSRQAILMPKAKTKKSKYIFLFLRIAVVTAGIIWGLVWISRGDT